MGAEMSYVVIFVALGLASRPTPTRTYSDLRLGFVVGCAAMAFLALVVIFIERQGWWS